MHRSILLPGLCLWLASPILAQESAGKAEEALLRSAGLGADGQALLDYLTRQMVDRDRVQDLIRRLGDRSFQVREKASADLIALGPAAVKDLEEAIKNPDLEIAARARECLQRIGGRSSVQRLSAVVRLLAIKKPDGAARVLLDYLPHAWDEALADEVLASLGAVAVRDGKTEPLLIAALSDKDPLRRAAAAEALVRARANDQIEAVRKLLTDDDPAVRARVSRVLIRAGLLEKEQGPRLQQFLAVREAYYRAYFRGDTREMDKYEASGFVVFGERGASGIQKKEEWLRDIRKLVEEKKWAPRGIEPHPEDIEVRIVGKSAVVSGGGYVTVPGQPREWRALTEIWIEQNDRWLINHLHYNRIVEEAERK